MELGATVSLQTIMFFLLLNSNDLQKAAPIPGSCGALQEGRSGCSPLQPFPLQPGNNAPTLLAQVDVPAFDEGLERMGHRDFDGAILSFNQCIGSNSLNGKAYFKRGQCFYYLQNFKLAIDDFSAALNCDAKNSEYYLWRGATKCKSGDNPHSIADYEEALRIDPSLLKAALANSPGQTDERAGKPQFGASSGGRSETKTALNEQSVRNYMEAVRIVSNNVFPVFAGGSVFGGIIRPEYQGDQQVPYLRPEGLDDIVADPKAAADAARRQLERTPADALSHFRRALAFQLMGKQQKSLDEFAEAIGQQPNNLQYLLARAYAQHLNKNDAAAMEDIRKAQALDSSLPLTIKFPAK